MCFQERTLEATADPASKRINGIPRTSSWAAAASPTGPAPITATGSDCFASITIDFNTKDGEIEKRCRFQRKIIPYFSIKSSSTMSQSSFEIKTPKDLYLKLVREHERIMADLWSSDYAINFSITAHHVY